MTMEVMQWKIKLTFASFEYAGRRIQAINVFVLYKVESSKKVDYLLEPPEKKWKPCSYINKTHVRLAFQKSLR